MVALFKDIYRHRELLFLLAGRNLKIRYKNSALGFFWSLLVPLFMICIYAFFLRVMKIPIRLPVLVTGIIVWQFFAMCLGDSVHAIVGNANLVTKSLFPRIVLPLSMVAANLVNFLLSCAVLLAYLVVVQVNVGALWWFPLIVLIQGALCLGVSLLFSCINVFFRDAEHLLQMVMLAWFFLTPVIYPIKLVTDNEDFGAWIRALFFCNPMTGIVTCYRMVFLSAENPGWELLSLSFVVAGIVCIVGVVVFQKLQSRFGDEL